MKALTEEMVWYGMAWDGMALQSVVISYTYHATSSHKNKNLGVCCFFLLFSFEKNYYTIATHRRVVAIRFIHLSCCSVYLCPNRMLSRIFLSLFRFFILWFLSLCVCVCLNTIFFLMLDSLKMLSTLFFPSILGLFILFPRWSQDSMLFFRMKTKKWFDSGLSFHFIHFFSPVYIDNFSY